MSAASELGLLVDKEAIVLQRLEQAAAVPACCQRTLVRVASPAEHTLESSLHRLAGTESTPRTDPGAATERRRFVITLWTYYEQC